MVSRVDRSRIANWWWTVDRPLLAVFLALMLFGMVLSFAASPPVAERLGLDPFHFVKRHAVYYFASIFVLIAASFLSEKPIRRAALILFTVSIVLMLATLFVGLEVKGAKRWIAIAGFSLQPSEFVKPAFVILAGWLFAENSRRQDIPGNLFAILLLAIVVALLVAQPDFGQTVLVLMVWGLMFFMAGVPWIWIAGLGTVAVIGLAAAYFSVSHVAQRIDRFLDPSSGDTFQIDTAIESFIRGGWFGRGPGEGTVKRVLPDSHTDFIFAVAAEEFGIIACLLLLGLCAFVVFRGLSHAFNEADPFRRLAISGLTGLFGLQASINFSVNLKLMPAKGMTLPFVSYGGSSLLAMAFAMGLLLALARRRPQGTTITNREPSFTQSTIVSA